MEAESKEVKNKITKLLTPTLKGASHEGENEREGRRRRWWRWRSLVTAPVPDECFDESRPHRDSSRFGPYQTRAKFELGSEILLNFKSRCAQVELHLP